jgi:hypothetical protein
LTTAGGCDGENRGGDGGHPGAEAVHVVQEIERVGDEDDPKNGRGDGERRGQQLDGPDTDGSGDEQSDRELGAELGNRSERSAVVDESHQMKDECSPRNRKDRRQLGCDSREVGPH